LASAAARVRVAESAEKSSGQREDNMLSALDPRLGIGRFLTISRL